MGAAIPLEETFKCRGSLERDVNLSEAPLDGGRVPFGYEQL